MPMIDVYATTGTFKDRETLARDLAAAVMRWEGVPDIPLFRNNTAAFVHDLPPGAISDVAGNGSHVRVQVLTPADVLNREKQAWRCQKFDRGRRRRGGRSNDAERTWVLIVESPDGGWGHCRTSEYQCGPGSAGPPRTYRPVVARVSGSPFSPNLASREANQLEELK